MSNKKKVLVVDNQPHWLELLAELLINEYEVTTAKNLAEARDALLTETRPFHVVISEIRLEASDQTNEEGLQLLAELNQMSSSTQSIVITGYPNIRTAKKSLRDLDVFEYMLKYPEDGQGFDHNGFRQVVHQAVKKADKLMLNHELAIRFFKKADFDIEPDSSTLFWVRHNKAEWLYTGKMPVYCVKKGKPVTANQLESLVCEAKKAKQQATVAFIIFHEEMTQGTIKRLWELRQDGTLTVIPIHVSEIRQMLQEPSHTSDSIYWKLVTLRHEWSTIVDPYASVNSLSNPEWFFGAERRQHVKKIALDVISGINVAIFGMRRIGKTTVLNQLALECEKQGHPVAKIVCRPFSASYTYQHILSQTIQEWHHALAALYPDFVMPPFIERENDPLREADPEKFKEVVITLAKAVQRQINESIKLVLALDEVDHIFPGQNNSPEASQQYVHLTQILKSVLESPRQPGMMSLIVVMEYPFINDVSRLEQNDQKTPNPLYGRFAKMPLDLLLRSDWDEMVQKIGALAGLEYADDSLELLYDQTAGHPELTKKLGSTLVDLRDSAEIDNLITPQAVYLALDSFLEDRYGHVYYLETTFWQDPLSTDLDTEQRIIAELAQTDNLSKEALSAELSSRYKTFIQYQNGKAASDEEVEREKKKICQALRRLIELRIVSENKQHQTVKIRLPIYRDWVRQEILATLVTYP